MKKSEMLQKMVEAIENMSMVDSYGYYIRPDDYEVAETILAVVQEYGMKPPLTKNCPVLLVQKHIWEPENE